MEAEVDLPIEAPVPQVEEVVIVPPNQRERIGNLGLRRKAAISTIPELSFFGLAEVMSKQARLRHTYVCSVPSEIISINKEENSEGAGVAVKFASTNSRPKTITSDDSAPVTTLNQNRP